MKAKLFLMLLVFVSTSASPVNPNQDDGIQQDPSALTGEAAQFASWFNPATFYGGEYD